MKTSKKAQVEISFNWVFVLIAGAAILFIFLRIIGTETEFAQTATQRRAIHDMTSLLTVLQQNPDSISNEKRINYLLEFNCNTEGHSYGIQGATNPARLPHQIIFSPKTVGEARIVTWVKTLRTPYPVSSILYLTDHETMYIFLKDAGQTAENYYDLFPEEIPKTLTTANNLNDYEDEGHRNIIIIKNTDANINYNLIKNNLDTRKITHVVSINNNNEVKFINIQNTNEEKNFGSLTEELVIGAIITGNPNLFNCTLNKALDQTRIITDLMLERTKLLNTAYGSNPCNTYYSSINQKTFQDLSNAARNKQPIYGHVQDIKNLNDRILRTNCVPIY